MSLYLTLLTSDPKKIQLCSDYWMLLEYDAEKLKKERRTLKEQVISLSYNEKSPFTPIAFSPLFVYPLDSFLKKHKVDQKEAIEIISKNSLFYSAHSICVKCRQYFQFKNRSDLQRYLFEDGHQYRPCFKCDNKLKLPYRVLLNRLGYLT